MVYPACPIGFLSDICQQYFASNQQTRQDTLFFPSPFVHNHIAGHASMFPHNVAEYSVNVGGGGGGHKHID